MPRDAHCRGVSERKVARGSSFSNACLISTLYMVVATLPTYLGGPSLLIDTPNHFYHLDHCYTPCPPLHKFNSSLVSCKNVTAAASDSKSHLFRVVTCRKQPSSSLLAKMTLMQDIYFDRVKDKKLVVVNGRECLACACERGLKICERAQDEKPSRIIVLN